LRDLVLNIQKYFKKYYFSFLNDSFDMIIKKIYMKKENDDLVNERIIILIISEYDFNIFKYKL
jgi:hypothetical protein